MTGWLMLWMVLSILTGAGGAVVVKRDEDWPWSWSLVLIGGIYTVLAALVAGLLFMVLEVPPFGGLS